MSMLLCDFHIHTTWSDGPVPLPEVVDIYGQAGFDVIAVTDHIYNSDSPIRGFEDGLFDNLDSFCRLDYPRYEIIFCLQSPDDPALRIARGSRLIAADGASPTMTSAGHPREAAA